MIIKNIVFDLGNVLFAFQPEEYLQERFAEPGLREKLYQAVFQSREWIELDRGTISEGEAIRSIKEKNPGLTGIEAVFEDWKEILRPIKGTIDLLPVLKGAGCRLYILSNFHLRPFELLSSEDYFRCFDGRVISCQVKAIKPEREIYQYLLDNFSLNPRETVFIDDREENLRAARLLGIKTILFRSPRQLKEELASLGMISGQLPGEPLEGKG